MRKYSLVLQEVLQVMWDVKMDFETTTKKTRKMEDPFTQSTTNSQRLSTIIRGEQGFNFLKRIQNLSLETEVIISEKLQKQTVTQNGLLYFGGFTLKLYKILEKKRKTVSLTTLRCPSITNPRSLRSVERHSPYQTCSFLRVYKTDCDL